MRRSDDPLFYTCTTEAGETFTGAVPSLTEGGKLAASILFFDFGITDAITDKHRHYPANWTVRQMSPEEIALIVQPPSDEQAQDTSEIGR